MTLKGATHSVGSEAMTEPLDYFNPFTPAKDAEVRTPSHRRPGRAAIPAEFDTLLTRSEDHAAIRAIEVALAAERIACFRVEGQGTVDRPVELHVCGADAVRASQVASELFARRQRVSKLLRHRRYRAPRGGT
jgi:hypothetical protein